MSTTSLPCCGEQPKAEDRSLSSHANEASGAVEVRLF